MLVKAKQLLSQMTSLSSGIVARFGKSDKPFYRRLWFWAGLGVGSGVIAFNYGISSIDKTLPDASALKAVIREQTLTIKAADGTILQQQGEATREQLKIEQIPDTVKKAFIASEDRRFTQHSGVDPQGIIRAIFNNLRSQDLAEGGSTITQQLTRILFLKQEKTFWRKLKEVRLAQKMEKNLTKNQILERYLNLVYLGAGAYGVADASWVYFSKPVDKLDLPEIATIAGLAPAPSIYAPDKNPSAAIARRNLVLQRMEDDGVITPTQKQAAIQAPLILKTSVPKRLAVESPYFTTYIQKELPKHVSSDILSEGGLVVETSLSPTWQQAGEAAVAKTLKNQGRSDNFKQAALVCIDPRNGEIRAMVGGTDFAKTQFNRVTQAMRQPGSTFKGFVYATAIATGKNPYDTYQDEPLVIDGYEPKNFGRNFHGSMTMKEALTRSVNIVAVKVLIDVGFEPTIKLAHAMGIKSELKPTYSLALGSSEVNLLELTSGYGSFATQGLHTDVHGIRRVLNRRGEVVWSANYKPQRVLDKDSAAIMTWMLRGVVEEGTGGAAQLEKRAVAGKTGTSDQARDLWFIGYIPQLVSGVWLGNDDNTPTWGSSAAAAATWHEFMQIAVKDMAVEKFPERPKLEGRKGSIKPRSVKPKRIEKRPITVDKSTDEETSRNSETPRKRRNYRTDEETSRNSETPRKRRNYTSDSSTENTSRRKRRESIEKSDTPHTVKSRREGSGKPTESSRPERQSKPIESQPKRQNSSGASSSGTNWRERLKPSKSSESGTGKKE